MNRSAFMAVVTVVAGLLLSQNASAQISVGPDGFNHIMADGISPSLFSYVDISATGALVATGDDAAGTVTFPTGKTLLLYGADRASLRVSTNGYLTTDLTDTGGDYDNDCPLPAAPSSGGGDRIYVLHDDLVADVYYQYFPGSDVSVIQWQGVYYNTTLVVDFEILIFHSLDAALIQYDAVDDFGFSSTTGSQAAGAATGLTYACNTDLTLFAGDLLTFGTLALNELRVDQPAADNDEYFELAGVSGFSLNNLTLIAIGDGSMAQGSGVIEAVVSLNGRSFASDGTVRFIGAETTYTLGTPDATFTLNYENTDTVTHVLVAGFTGANGQDLDTNDDGLLDLLPWTQTVDVVSVLQEPQPPVSSEWAYATTALVGPYNGVAPFHVQRCPDVKGAWVVAEPDPALGGDTPTALNDCPICGDSAISFPEQCDDGGESLTCDTDCTPAMCGDGLTNATASETCDGDGMGMGGETATCDLDCTAAQCGDTVVNVTANESCDDGGESASCDDDCTPPVCGDGNENTAAGEQCDDGNTQGGDGCDALCMDEGAGGQGGTGQGGMGQGGMAQGGMGQGGMGQGGMTTAQGGMGGGMGPGATVSVGNGGTGNTGNTATTGSGNNNDDNESEGGCSCSTPKSNSSSMAAWALMFGVGLMAARRRRRG